MTTIIKKCSFKSQNVSVAFLFHVNLAKTSPLACLIIPAVINVTDGFNMGLLVIYVHLNRSEPLWS